MNGFDQTVTHVTDYQFEVALYYLHSLCDDEALLSLLDMKMTSDVWCKLLNGGIPQKEFFNTCGNIISSNHKKLKFSTDKQKLSIPTDKIRKHEYPWYVKNN